MNVKFFSDGSVVKKGFRARFNAICGGRIMAESEAQDLFSHPNFGEPYGREMECEWLVTAPNAAIMAENEEER